VKRSLKDLKAAKCRVGDIGALEFLINRESAARTESEQQSTECIAKSLSYLSDNESLVFSLDPAMSGWADWKLTGGVTCKPFGNLLLEEGHGRLIASNSSVSLEPGSFYKLHYSYAATTPDLKAYLTIVPVGSRSKRSSYFEDNIAPISADGDSSSCDHEHEFYFRAPSQISTVQLGLAVGGSDKAALVAIRHITISKIKNPEAEFKPQIGKDEKIIASLASIPDRRASLPDLIASLECQVDEIRVFLNNHEDVPAVLRSHPKIQIASSNVFGDQGDLGKFHWAEDETLGYRIICDDDIAYPPDYVKRLVNELKEMGERGVVGVHGALLRQPIHDYYGQDQRKVYHFRNGIAKSKCCHVLGTGTIGYKVGSISIDKFTFQCRNMADIWFAKKANAQQISLRRISSPHNWLRDLDSSTDSIYEASFQQTGGSFDTRSLQSHALRTGPRLTIPPARTADKMKVVLGVKTYNRLDYLRECIDSFIRTRSEEYNWVLIVADDGSEDGTIAYLDSQALPVEFHVIKNKRRYAVGQTNTILDLAINLDFDFGFNIDDDLVFTEEGWDSLYINAVERCGYSHLVHRHLRHAENLLKNQDESAPFPFPVYDKSLLCVAYGDSFFDLGTGSLVTFTKDTIGKVGYCDEENFPIRGQWHVDYHIRCARAGCNDPKFLFDAVGSNDYLEIQNYLSEDYRCAIPWGEEYKKTKDRRELERRYRVLGDESRIFVPYQSGAARRPKIPNDIIDHIYVPNLDRRPDRLRDILDGAKSVGLDVSRFPAVDGSKEPYCSQYWHYSSEPLADFPIGYEVGSSYQVYRGDAPHAARVAFFEQKSRRKAIGSLGAWGYLHSMIHILKDALESEYETILILDDDARFHKQFSELFMRHYEQLPTNWKIWQLGALQYNWGPDWVSWSSDELYSCHGSSVGSHAVMMNRSIIPMVLDECRRLDLPYDEGPLHKPKALFPDLCLTSYPNLVIQDVTESDISSETEQVSGGGAVLEKYRWDISEYSIG